MVLWTPGFLLCASFHLGQLLRRKCFHCHHFKMRSDKVRVAATKLLLLDVGESRRAMGLEEELAGIDGDELGDQAKQDHKEAVLEACAKLAAKKGPVRRLQTHERQAWRAAVKAFFAAMPMPSRACENCKAFSPSLRKDGHAKLFLKDVGEKQRRVMEARGQRIEAAFKAGTCVPVFSGSGSTSGKSGDAKMSNKDDSGSDDDDADDDDDDSSDDDGDDDDSEEEEEEEEEESGSSSSAASRRSKAAAAAAAAAAAGKSKLMPALEAEKQLELLWEKEQDILSIIWRRGIGDVDGTTRWTARSAFGAGDADLTQAPPTGVTGGWNIFFIRVVPVSPARFRPPTVLGELTFEHPHNVYLQRILNANERVVQAVGASSGAGNGGSGGSGGSGGGSSGAEKTKDLKDRMNAWLELQEAVNCMLDSSKASRGAQDAPQGLRQILEKKEGLFRRNMMGKRVNYACRSVISPDPYVDTHEIGLPVRFAKALTYRQPVTNFNVVAMRAAVINGADVHPGANFVEDEFGRKTDLSKLDLAKRKALAQTLQTCAAGGGREAPLGACKKVWRHLISGDAMLVNRQPTLHKPSIMAHVARVLNAKTQHSWQTIRMHYANCNTYNADFDGDEINLHFPQNELARAEAYQIVLNSRQYCVPTDGSPLRGLIQDHVGCGVLLTKRDTFLTRDEYMQLVYAACASITGGGGEEVTPIRQLPPAILKPRALWTGKQVISTVLAQLTAPDLPPLNLNGKSKMPAKALGEGNQEHVVVIRSNELLQGVLDKAAFGASSFGLVHSVYELYGPDKAGCLLTALGRLFTHYLQIFGAYTCGLADMVLVDKAEKERAALIAGASEKGRAAAARWAVEQEGGDPDDPASVKNVDTQATLRRKIQTDVDGQASGSLDNAYKTVFMPLTSSIISTCLPNGQYMPFPRNNLSLMVLPGAKGSGVNHSQISCCLGQQELEGKRVPRMISGKTLPSFQPHDPDPRAGGYITDRFLTGLRPQDYYFHCMAGREGLVDTAVKTSRSGYLQRCLVKHLEDLHVAYDYTVRDCDGSVVQFTYGEDGLDALHTQYLSGDAKQFDFLALNKDALAYKYNVPDIPKLGLDTKSAAPLHRAVSSAAAAAAAAGAAGSQEEDAGVFKVGAIVLARTVKAPAAEGGGKVPAAAGKSFKRHSLLSGWHAAEVTKVRPGKGGDGTTYDVKYLKPVAGAAKAAKKVPAALRLKVPSLLGGTEVVEDADEAELPLIKAGMPDPVMAMLDLAKSIGCSSERLQTAMDEYVAANKAGLITDGGESSDGDKSSSNPRAINKRMFQTLLWIKYMKSLAEPGEAVGPLAAQSVGEPSTQMTLNTFHLAGHGGANVTLGIPRLRELLMTAAAQIKTPSMLLPLKQGTGGDEAASAAKRLQRVALDELLHHSLPAHGAPGKRSAGLRVSERLRESQPGTRQWVREYRVRLTMEPSDLVKSALGIDSKEIETAVGKAFVPKLLHAISVELKKAGAITSSAASAASKAAAEGAGNGNSGAGAAATAAVQDEEDQEDSDNDEDDGEQGTLRFGPRGETVGYDDDEDDEEDDSKDSDDDDSDDDDDMNGGGSAGGGGAVSPGRGAGKKGKGAKSPKQGKNGSSSSSSSSSNGVGGRAASGKDQRLLEVSER